MKLIFRFLRPYKMLVFFTLIVMVLDVAGGLLIPTITADMINYGVGGENMDYLLNRGAWMLAITVVTGFGALAGSYLCADLAAKIGRDMRNALYDKSLTFSANDFEEFGTGSMITRTLNDVNIVQQGIVWFIQMVLPVPAVCLMGIVMAFAIDVMMGILLIGVTVFIIFLAVLISRKASLIFEKLQEFLDRMNVILRENVTGVRVIRAFNKEPYEKSRMRVSFEDYAQSAISANRLFVALDSTALFAMNICIVLILWLGGNRIGAGFMQIGDITALTEYAIMILFYIIMAQMVLLLLPRAMICMRRISTVLSREPEIRDERTEREFCHEQKDLTEAGEKHNDVIRFDDVCFRFADADEDTLGNISFCCRRGQTTAIIGSTGSGKSTIAKLILRFHDVTSGSVLLNGKDIRSISQEELRRNISYVPQKAWLFSGTIAQNLAHGKENATREEMEHALKIAQCGFVEELDAGVDARVAQGGTNFSGGQKQRLAIARALMRNAQLYIFDDSFSALDFQTDAALRKALANETKDAAVLIIAQRISTIMNAEQIIVLEDGKVVGMGTHDRLLEQCDVYRDIAKSQMKGGDDIGRK